MDVDSPVEVLARPSDLYPVFINRRAPFVNMFDQGQQGRSERQQPPDFLPDQQRTPDVEKSFGGCVRVFDAPFARDGEDRRRQRIEDTREQTRVHLARPRCDRRFRRFFADAHAAACSVGAEKISSISLMASPDTTVVTSCRRRSATFGAAGPKAWST